MQVVADTHAALWYLTASSELSTFTADTLRNAAGEGDPIYLPSISLVEVTYLMEKGRLPSEAFQSLIDGIKAADGASELIALDADVARSVGQIPRDAIPDVPDRIIAATALHLDLPLVTRDERIRQSFVETIW